MIAVGTVLLVPAFQLRFASAAGPVSNWTERRFGKFSTSGINGQIGVGLLLGAVWTPCVGPTLGAASLMAARGQNLGQVALTMLLFGIGTALPLLVLGLLSGQALMQWRGHMNQTASALKMALGVLMILAGGMTLTGLDRAIQTTLTEIAPGWLVSLTTAV